jgi:hypothetical protein
MLSGTAGLLSLMSDRLVTMARTTTDPTVKAGLQEEVAFLANMVEQIDPDA